MYHDVRIREKNQTNIETTPRLRAVAFDSKKTHRPVLSVV